MADSYEDMLRSLLGGIGSVGSGIAQQGRLGGLGALETNAVAGTWQGIERNTAVPFQNLSARIQFSGTAIAASQQQEGAFARAVRDEWQAIANHIQQYEQMQMYAQGRQWLKAYGDSWDPDMEMDIGL